MGQDYYSILKLTRSASDADIKKAYKKEAQRYHPLKNADSQEAVEKFRLIAEAYDVLSDRELRILFNKNKKHLKELIKQIKQEKKAVYDQFGEEGLKSGVPDNQGEGGAWTCGYSFHGDGHKVFREFFGGDNPFQEYYDRLDGDLHWSFGGLHGRGAKKQDNPIERDLALSLEEVFHGCTKKMKISRKVMNDDGHTSSIRDKILTITVKKGWLPNTRVTFPQEGDQGPNKIPADIVFILKDKSHPRFRREGSNLIHKANVPLGRALTGHVVEILTLDERTLYIPINDIIKPGYIKTVPREGMPISSNPEQKGDLILEFDIEFPKTLNTERKDLVKKALLL